MSSDACLTVLTPYGRSGGSSRVRVYDWLDWFDLPAATHSYISGRNNRAMTLIRHPVRLLRAEWDVRFMRPSSLPLLVSREASPFSRGELESRLLRGSAHGTYDLDDALFADRGTGVRRVFSKATKSRVAALNADTVIAGSPAIADWANKYNANVVLIPSCVDPFKYVAKNNWSINAEPRIVWLGSPSTEQYLTSIAGPLLKIRERLGARLILISAGSATMGALDAMVTRVPWSEAKVHRELATADVAIAPLTDTPYARGKCAYKILQYAAAGLPVVGSPVGTNATALEKLGGTPATSQSDWFDALMGILTSAASVRAEIGIKARFGVDRNYSFRAWEEHWLKAVGIDWRPTNHKK